MFVSAYSSPCTDVTCSRIVTSRGAGFEQAEGGDDICRTVLGIVTSHHIHVVGGCTYSAVGSACNISM